VKDNETFKFGAEFRTEGYPAIGTAAATAATSIEEFARGKGIELAPREPRRSIGPDARARRCSRATV
jgi:hypothetical protein